MEVIIAEGVSGIDTWHSAEQDILHFNCVPVEGLAPAAAARDDDEKWEATMKRTILSLALLLLCGTAKANPPEKIKLNYHRGPGAPMALRDHAYHYAYLFNSVSV